MSVHMVWGHRARDRRINTSSHMFVLVLLISSENAFSFAKAPDAVTLGAGIAACDRGQQWQLAICLLHELSVPPGKKY